MNFIFAKRVTGYWNKNNLVSHIDCVILLNFKLTTLLEMRKLFSATSYYLKAISGFSNFQELIFWKKKSFNFN